jgi:drug/metabolite transporter (DMT)-like permease
MVFWGMSFVWSKIVLHYYEPVTTVLLRLIISSALLFGGLAIFGKLSGIRKKDIRLFMLSALFNPFLYFLGENYGLKFSSPTVTAVIIATIPVFTPFVAFFAFHEKLSPLNIFGLIFSFFGVVYMLFDFETGFIISAVGISWLMLAVFTAVFYSVLLKKLAAKYDPFVIIAFQNLFGAIYFLPLFFVFDFQIFIAVTPNFELVSSLLLLAFFASSLAFVFFTIGSREIGISKTNLFTNLIPVFTAIFAFFMVGEIIDKQKILGMVIVIAGVLMSQLTADKGIMGIYRFIFFKGRVVENQNIKWKKQKSK